jgi:hypothetical protein
VKDKRDFVEYVRNLGVKDLKWRVGALSDEE